MKINFKCCMTCNIVKDIKHFNKNNRHCKKCIAKKIKQKRQETKKHLLKRRGNKCEDCGLEYDGENIYYFTFHHVKPEEKKFELSANKNYSLKELEEEADKCIILCHNCHNKYHYINGFK